MAAASPGPYPGLAEAAPDSVRAAYRITEVPAEEEGKFFVNWIANTGRNLSFLHPGDVGRNPVGVTLPKGYAWAPANAPWAY